MSKKTSIIIRNAAPSDFGGGERAPVLIASEIHRQTGQKIVVMSSSKQLLNFAKLHGVSAINSPWLRYQNWSGWRLIFLPLYLLWITGMIFYYLVIFLRMRPGLVHPQSKDDFIASTLAARLLGIRVVWSDYADLKHIFMNVTVWYRNPVGKLVYSCALLADKIIVVSKNDLREIKLQIPGGSVAKKLAVVYNGASDAGVRHKKSKFFTFVYSGRLVMEKGVGELIDAFNLVTEKYPNSKLIIIGNGPDRVSFEKVSRSNPAISFLGHKNNAYNAIARSTVFVLPTHHEGFSLSLVEACMLRMPIIATAVGGNAEIIEDGNNGLLVSEKDVGALLGAMVRLIEDAKLREKIAGNARITFEKSYRFEDIVTRNFLGIYKGTSS